MDETQDFSSLQDQIQAALISTTKTTGQISSEDLTFQRSLKPEIGALLDEQSARLLELSNELLKSATSISELNTPVLEDQDDLENRWRSIVDVIDSLLEKTDSSLDEYKGVLRHKQSTFTEQDASKSKKPSLGNAFRTQNLVKPQLAFIVKPDNKDNSPWKPLLTTKPHAITPLERSFSTFMNDFNQKQYQHPYETEILQFRYPDTVYQKADPIPFLPIETTSAVFVDTFEGVLEMLKELETAKEIAIDLEHHDARSYVGLTSLMQISTRQKDWIVDTLKPWRQDLQVLNQVFADPSILKVLHGAYMDIVWLQRDLGLYVVGLFDTHHASRTLGYAGGSLAFLLKKFINFDADKKYQLADWRIRPIPEEMFFYARADTHYLLYIYDHMRNDLIDRTKSEMPEENRIDLVLQKSKETSLLCHERQLYHADTGKGPGGWYTFIMKAPSLFNSEQFAVFKAVHAWRDEVARTDDDSTAFVMPNNVMISIAKLMPIDMMALLGIVHPSSHSVKSRAAELLALIKNAKASGKEGPNMMDLLRPDSLGAIAKANFPVLPVKSTAITNALLAVEDESQLRSDESSFWGGAFGSSIWDAPTARTEDMRLGVPFPALSSDVYEASQISTQHNGGALTDRSRPQGKTPTSSSSQPNTPQSKPEDEAFVLKRGGKRKNEVGSGSEESSARYDTVLYGSDRAVEEHDDLSSLNPSKKGEARAKQQAGERKSRKAAKQAKKTRLQEDVQWASHNAAAGAESDEVMDSDTPFDYSKAESVLHGKGNGEDREGAGKGKKAFNPYAKSADAPKGMKRVQTERPGKSHTFKG